MFTRAPHTPSRRSISTRVLLLEEEDLKQTLESSSTNNADATTQSTTKFERLVVRDLPFHQSSNSVRVRHQSSRQSIIHRRTMIFPLPFHWYEDWFHVLLRLRTIVSILLFVTIWTLFLLDVCGDICTYWLSGSVCGLRVGEGAPSYWVLWGVCV